MSTRSIISLSTSSIEQVVAQTVEILRADGVVVFPTETVYGIGARLSFAQVDTAQRIYDIKRRPHACALPVLVGDISWLERLAPAAPAYAHQLARALWPGALTLVVPASKDRPHFTGAAPDGTLALRCPDHDFVRALLSALDEPLYATSANTHGAPSPAASDDLEQRIVEAVDLVVDGGACKVGSPSTIVDCTDTTPFVLREGEITQEDIERILL